MASREMVSRAVTDERIGSLEMRLNNCLKVCAASEGLCSVTDARGLKKQPPHRAPSHLVD